MPLAYYRQKTLNILTPIVHSQLSQHLTKEGDEADDKSNFIRHCAKLSEKNDVGGIGNQVSPAGFAGSSSTIIQSTNLLIDLANCAPELHAFEQLRAEAEATLQGDDQSWEKASTFRKQSLADSAIRESLRLHPILIKGLTKEVIPPTGLQLPDGTHIPRGGWIGVPVLGIHQDERFYHHAQTYEPFRFVKKPRHNSENSARYESETASGSLTTSYEDEPEAGKPTTTYLGFGYGRHAWALDCCINVEDDNFLYDD
ncbi:cytochrome P450 [Thozetella sp. PMI_491]|nr:cytochrome P450 [Thozetella sp. PMI_491]